MRPVCVCAFVHCEAGRERVEMAQYHDTEFTMMWLQTEVCMANCHRKPRRRQAELHLSLQSLIGLLVLATSVTCHSCLRQEAEHSELSSRHKHQFGILQMPVFFYTLRSDFWGGLRFLFLAVPFYLHVFVHPHTPPMHMGSHTHVHHIFPDTLLTLLLTTAEIPLSGEFGCFSVMFSSCIKAQRKHILLTENTLLCIRLETHAPFGAVRLLISDT